MRPDMLNERFIDDYNYKIPVETLKKNPLLGNKGNVYTRASFIPYYTTKTKQKKHCSTQIKRLRSRVDYGNYFCNANIYDGYKYAKLTELKKGHESTKKAFTIDLKTQIKNKQSAYNEEKNNLTLSKCVEEIFLNTEYQQELKQILDFPSNDSPRPYKYQMESIEKIAKDNFPLIHTSMLKVKV